MSERRFSTQGVLLAVASGFLAGVLLVAILGGAKGRETETVTVARTVTVPAATTNPGTVIVTTAVPDLVGERLNVAKERVDRAGFDLDVVGGGLLGVIVESNWEVTSQDPAPGGQLEQGSTVEVRIARR
ncbi:PASTA domain-containing protein [Paraconexibacter sp.]|uniref:PASTA domain-containing protein n=1 Tax=Paraconexibacter sp. TaxID=2949640 RepID=UPI003566F99D